MIADPIDREGDKEIVEITLASGELIQATSGHPFYVRNTENEWAWKDAGELLPESILISLDGGELQVTSTVRTIQYADVFNLTVNNDHTYYVGQNELLSHNSGSCIPLSGINKKHILRGEVNEFGYATGWYHRPSGDNPSWRRLYGSPSAPDANGVYRARVMIKDPRTGEWRLKTQESTFFPDNWSETTVLNRVQEAYLKAVSSGRVSGDGKFSGRAGGVLIEGYIDANGIVKTAFPRYGE